MIALRAGELAAITAGQLLGLSPDTLICGDPVIDSRTVTPGSVFVALPGEHVDGHDFVQRALDAGAALALVSRPVNGPAILVPDVLAALTAWARHQVRLACADQTQGAGSLRVVGITGSAGKTSTKDLLAAVLRTAGPTVAPQGSFNNEIGVPLTALQVTEQTDYLVAEMGARGPGHIDFLCDIVTPQVGIVLNVGVAHLGMFGGVEQTAQAKGELVAALPSTGAAILNADDPAVAAMASRCAGEVITFGESATAQVRAIDVTLDELARATFTVQTPVGEHCIRLGVHGAHQVSNALAVIAAATYLGLPLAQIAQALEQAGPSALRMQVVPAGDVLLINDSYNANPDSVRAALRALSTIGAERGTWAVLGEMLELGPGSHSEHQGVGQFAAQAGIDHLVVVGPGATGIAEGAVGPGPGSPRTVCVSDPGEAEALLRSELSAGDVVLVKASRSVGLDRLAQALMKEPVNFVRPVVQNPGTESGHNVLAVKGTTVTAAVSDRASGPVQASQAAPEPVTEQEGTL